MVRIGLEVVLLVNREAHTVRREEVRDLAVGADLGAAVVPANLGWVEGMLDGKRLDARLLQELGDRAMADGEATVRKHDVDDSLHPQHLPTFPPREY